MLDPNIIPSTLHINGFCCKCSISRETDGHDNSLIRNNDED
jgi:hypothetical protein